MQRKRYSYSWENAARYIPIYKQLIELYKSPTPGLKKIELDCNKMGRSVHTIHSQVVDGLKWLVDKYDFVDPGFKDDLPPVKDLAMLRLVMRAHVEELRGVVDLKINITATCGKLIDIGATRVITTTEVTSTGLASFRSAIENFLGDPNKRFEQFKDLILTEGDKTWLNGVLSNPSLTFHWQENNLTIVKE
jgi:hypothetical protein